MARQLTWPREKRSARADLDFALVYQTNRPSKLDLKQLVASLLHQQAMVQISKILPAAVANSDSGWLYVA